MRTIAILMGGYSGEASVSMKSGATIYNNIDKAKFNPYKVVLTKEAWYVEHEGKKLAIQKGDFSFELDGEKVIFDCVFNIIHGTPGEDGIIQAYLDTIGIAHTSCPFYQSALTFNKKDCLAVLNKYGIRSAESVFISKTDVIDDDAIIQKVGMPCFVKPNKGGSSIGASKVNAPAELKTAIQKAFKEDDEVLIESFIEGTEVSVGVVKYKNQVQVLGITEIISENDFFDFEAKYQGKSNEITPARLSESMTIEIEKQARKVYETLKMEGLSRSEFIINDGLPYLLEMNTNPGFSEASILPQQAKLAGIAIPDLITDMIETAINRT